MRGVVPAVAIAEGQQFATETIISAYKAGNARTLTLDVLGSVGAYGQQDVAACHG